MSWKSISNSQYSKLLGSLETKRENDKDYYRMIVLKSHLNSGNFAHGGFLTSFLDNVMGNAAFKSFDNKPCVTISMSTHFTYSASMGDELIGQPIIEKKTNKLNFTEIFPDAMGLFFVLTTSLSNFLSNTSLTIHPADLINTAPRKNKIK